MNSKTIIVSFTGYGTGGQLDRKFKDATVRHDAQGYLTVYRDYGTSSEILAIYPKERWGFVTVEGEVSE